MDESKYRFAGNLKLIGGYCLESVQPEIECTEIYIYELRGHRLDRTFNCLMYFSKLGDTHHVEYFFEVIGQPRNTDLLIVLFGLGQNLDQHGNTAAVDVGAFFEIEQ